MRKITTTLVLMVLALTLTGCGNSLVKKSIEQAKTAIESKEYDKALASLELALDEDKENKEVNKLYGIVDGYQKAKKLIDENNFDEAKKILDGINEDYTSYAIKEDIDVLKGYVETYTKENENIVSVLAKAEELYNNKQYTECKMSLYKNIVGKHVDEEIEPNKFATEEQKAKAEDLIIKCDQAITEMQAQKEAEEAKAKGTKQEYLKKLDRVEASLSDLSHLYESGVTSDMNEGELKTLKRWDDMLNEIYGKLKTQLSKSDMDEVTRKQLEWIKFRDKSAETESNQFAGGSMAGVQYNSTLARLTKERCYELVNNYMK